MENYNSQVEIKASAENVYAALTQEIPLWWTEMFEGAADREQSVFTVRFGISVYKTMQITELQPNVKVVWDVKDSLIQIPELRNQTEWIGTTIVWEIRPVGEDSILQLTHVGLQPSVECYEICAAGWQQFTASLKSYLETGKGTPYLEMS